MGDFDSNERVIARDFVVAGKFMKGIPTLEEKSKSLSSSDNLLTVFFFIFSHCRCWWTISQVKLARNTDNRKNNFMNVNLLPGNPGPQFNQAIGFLLFLLVIVWSCHVVSNLGDQYLRRSTEMFVQSWLETVSYLLHFSWLLPTKPKITQILATWKEEDCLYRQYCTKGFGFWVVLVCIKIGLLDFSQFGLISVCLVTN